MSVRIESISFPVRSYPHRVFYADTDAGGVVYYAQYLCMFERARGLYCEDLGVSLVDLAEQNCLFVCRRAELDYRIPALLGDRLNVTIWISVSTKLYFTFSYKVTCQNRLDEEKHPLEIAQGITKMVSCQQKEKQVKPCRIPAWVLERMTQGAAKWP